MIPILYDNTEKAFTSNGLGRLTDCIECTVTEERNGIYEAEFVYPITGVHYKDIIEGRIISITHDEKGDRQPFVIYRRSAVIDGRVTFWAHHVSYELSNVIVSPFSATSAAAALTYIKDNSITDNPFTFWTDKATSGSMVVDVPTPAKTLLGGKDGSVLDVFGGGEYEFDKFTVKLYQNRGTDSDVTIRYGKNLTNLRQERETLDLYNSVVPYWRDNQNGALIYGDVVTGNGGVEETALWTDHNNIYITDENGNEFEFKYVKSVTTTMDLSQEFEEMPTKGELEARALQILNSNQPWLPNESIDVDFVALWQTEEYKNIAPLQKVSLCDTVSVYYPELGVDAVQVKVIKTVYNVLLDRFDSLELGQPKVSFAEVITAETSTEVLEKSTSMMEEAIEAATSLITGGMGGHVVFSLDANGKPQEIFIMDTEDMATAIHVLRMNVNGIGFSSNGINGPFNTAWTLNGNFVADYITAGTMQANRIKGGTLTLGGQNNGNGTLVVYDANGGLIGEVNNEHFMLSYKNVRAFCGNEYTFYYYVVAGYVWQKVNGYGIYFNNDNGVRNAGITFSNSNVNFSESIITPARYYSRAIAVGIEETDISTTRPTLAGHMVEYYDGTTYKILTDTGNADEDFYLDCAYDHVYLANSFYSSSAETSYGGSGSRKISAGNNGIQLAGGGHYFIVDSTRRIIDGKTVSVESSSSKRYKHAITDKLDNKLNPHRLYELKTKQFVFNDDHLLQYEDMRGKTIPGFIAEDIDEIYPAATIHDAEGNIESWDERRIIPPMLSLIQEQRKHIEELENRVDKLERVLTNMLKGDM